MNFGHEHVCHSHLTVHDKICSPAPLIPHKLFAIILWLRLYCVAAVLPSNSKRLFPIIMPFNAIRMVIRLHMKYLHDTVVWVRWCGEVRKAAGGAFGRAEWLQPDLSLICETSSCSSIGCWRAGQGDWEAQQKTRRFLSIASVALEILQS